MYIIKSRKEMKDAIDMDRKYYDTQNDLFMKRTKHRCTRGTNKIK